MTALVHPVSTPHTPESLAERILLEPGVVLLRSSLLDQDRARYSLVAARPFLTFRSYGSRGRVEVNGQGRVRFGNPWKVLDELLDRYELEDEVDLPFPLGGCFGYWGYALKNFVEPGLPNRCPDDLELPDCHLGFYGSLVVFDHALARTWIVTTGLAPDGSRHESIARRELDYWKEHLGGRESSLLPRAPLASAPGEQPSAYRTSLSATEFIRRVEKAQAYIRSGDIYQVNLAQRLTAAWPGSAWSLYGRLAELSPAPFAAYLDAGDLQLVSSSPELFLRLSGKHVLTRPIKGTRPRSIDPTRDTQLTYELQTSPKELAELVMITDLLRHDLGKICEYGSVQVPELVRLERYAQVQHLVSTVEGQLRPGLTHLEALASCFPGGSITGAPKIRAMEIIDELEPVSRGPYTGALGYVGFNRESQLSIVIRTALCQDGYAHFHAGAGIVADSIPEAEHEETLHKALGFLRALESRDLMAAARSPGPGPGF